jgi:hypothetical protein
MFQKKAATNNNNLVKAGAILDMAENDKDDAKASLDKAEARLDKAEARFARLQAADAPADQIAAVLADVTAARVDVTSARGVVKSAMEVVKSAIDAGRPIGTGPEIKPFSFKPGVLEDLRRPLDKWKPCETFDVTGFSDLLGMNVRMWLDVVFVRADGIEVLREWEGPPPNGTPYLMVHGTPGIGKSTLLQLAVLRALAKGEWVVVYFKGEYVLTKMVDDGHISVERMASLRLGSHGRPSAKNVVMCYDSSEGFQVTVGRGVAFKAVLIVHSPSANRTNTEKSEGVVKRYFANPPVSELIAIAALIGIAVDGSVGIDAASASLATAPRFALCAAPRRVSRHSRAAFRTRSRLASSASSILPRWPALTASRSCCRRPRKATIVSPTRRTTFATRCLTPSRRNPLVNCCCMRTRAASTRPFVARCLRIACSMCSVTQANSFGDSGAERDQGQDRNVRYRRQNVADFGRCCHASAGGQSLFAAGGRKAAEWCALPSAARDSQVMGRAHRRPAEQCGVYVATDCGQDASGQARRFGQRRRVPGQGRLCGRRATRFSRLCSPCPCPCWFFQMSTEHLNENIARGEKVTSRQWPAVAVTWRSK